MSRDPSGIYSYPDGTRGVPDMTIFSARYNTFLDDLATTLNTKLPVNMGGTGADNATVARNNLDAEVSMQNVTNFDTHQWENGSFVAAPGATTAPVAGHWFIGTFYGGPEHATVQARDLNGSSDFDIYVRTRNLGVWGAWVSQQTVNDDRYVNSTGDTMTGDLTIAKVAPVMTFAKSTGGGQHSGFHFTTGGIERWFISSSNAAPEGGGNTGSDFSIYRYNDAGVYLGRPFEISRSTGEVLVEVSPSSSSAVTPKGYVDAGDAARVSVASPVAVNGRLWGENDGSPVFKGAVNTITNPMTINGNLAGMWVCSFINNSAAVNSSGIYTQVANDANMSLAVLNAAGNAWAHAFFGNGNYTASNSVTAPNFYGTLNGNITGAASYATNAGTAANLNGGSVTLGDGQVIEGPYFIDFKHPGHAAHDNCARIIVQADHSLGIESARLNINSDTDIQGVIFPNGYKGRAGTAGVPTNNFNIAHISGVQYLYIDSSNVGAFQYVSDYRTKKDVSNLASTWEKVKTLRPVSYTPAQYGDLFPASDELRWGFIAHELQETLIQSAATGVKDQENLIQSPNAMVVVAALTKALQEAMARIEALEART